jgi:hypothetical protein
VSSTTGYLTQKEIADAMGVSIALISRLCTSGRLGCRKTGRGRGRNGGGVQISTADFARLIDDLTVGRAA